MTVLPSQREEDWLYGSLRSKCGAIPVRVLEVALFLSETHIFIFFFCFVAVSADRNSIDGDGSCAPSRAWRRTTRSSSSCS